MTSTFTTIDDYIGSQGAEVQPVLQQVRRAICEAAPGAEETISYKIPAFKLNGEELVYFAGWKHHVSLYPVPKGDAAFRRRIDPYRAGKGTLKFPLKQPLPLDLIASVVQQLIAERRKG
ncbi:MAG: DUF1801 domain-containing protein [Candidatus Eremiobacteraeota bacterium]|nr:DUF1801 domain-containing protein [Candidatus Eremiobacteraeota bacterium]